MYIFTTRVGQSLSSSLYEVSQPLFGYKTKRSVSFINLNDKSNKLPGLQRNHERPGPVIVSPLSHQIQLIS